STKAPGVIEVAPMSITTEVTPLSAAALQAGMLSPASAISAWPLEMLLMFQSPVASADCEPGWFTFVHGSARQTGSLKVAVMRLPATATEVNVGAVVSLYV